MSDKSVQKKQMILEKAREVFAVKGYNAVTMKDIVEACDISRGGLYLYFDNTGDIFLEVLKKEYQEDDSLAGSISEKTTPADLLALFIREQKKEILNKKSSLVIACYEFYFSFKGDKKDHYVRQQFESGAFVVEKLLEKGVSVGEFACDDCRGCARNLMYVLEGLKAGARIYGLGEKAVDEAILYIMQGIMPR